MLAPPEPRAMKEVPMRNLKVVALTAIALAALVAPVVHTPLVARPAAQESMNFTVEGKITKHTENKLTLNSEGNMIFHVVYSEKSKVTRKDGSEGTPKDLLVGTRIHVDGELTESGEIIAQKISLQAESKK
jgi:hypothetical protein